MFQGNWKCSKCGGAITELPFQPRSEAGLTCRTCYAKSKDPAGGGNSGSSYEAPADTSTLGASTLDDRDVPDFSDFDTPSSEPMPDDGLHGAAPVSAEKPKFAGNWQCATCGAAITSLPFTPRDVTSLKCIDCFKRSKA